MIARAFGFLTTRQGLVAVLWMFVIAIVGAILLTIVVAFFTGKPLRVLGHKVANWEWTLPHIGFPSWEDGGDESTNPTPDPSDDPECAMSDTDVLAIADVLKAPEWSDEGNIGYKVRFKQSFNVPNGVTLQMNDAVVTSASAGDEGTLWVTCR